MMHAAPIATGRTVSGIPTGRLAVWWVVASEIMIFGGVLGSYLLLRLHYAHWGDYAAYTNVILGGINTFVLLTSSLFVVLGHQAAEKGEGKKAALYLWLTIGGGLTFLCIKAYEWTTEISHGFTISSNPFWSYYFTAAGIHAIHVIGGMVIMGIISIDAMRGIKLHRVELIGIYWHFVDLVWIFLFPLLYIAK